MKTTFDHALNCLAGYVKLNRIAGKTNRSQMSPEVHAAFMTYIDRAQQILRLEAEQAGFPDFRTISNVQARELLKKAGK